MSYSDHKFYSRPMVFVGAITGTATASGTNVLTAGDLRFAPALFNRKSVVNAIRFENVIATPANWTALRLIVKNGTSTVGTQTGLAAGTAGQVFTPTLTSTLATFAADSAPTYTLDGTSTASGQSLGTFNIFAEVQEQYS
jgi:hypothetical protein